MRAAPGPRPDPLRERLLCLDPQAGTFVGALIVDLPGLLRPGDLLVVNDAATLPASLRAVDALGREVEVRLAGEEDGGTWSAVLFGAGDWRQRTEDRPPPPRLADGDALWFGPGLAGRVLTVSADSPRLVRLRFAVQGPALWSALYRLGRPVQYSYLGDALRLGQAQTTDASRPWAVEIPSAGRPLQPSLLIDLRQRGIAVAGLTHAAGLSSTGDPTLDARLPLPERFDVPLDTVVAVRRAQERGGHVVAAGTTVVRALEASAAAHGGTLAPGSGTTELRIAAGYHRRVVNGLLTGLHEPGSSHFQLLEAFAPLALLERAFRHAEGEGYLAHEFGDSSLILPGVAARQAELQADEPSAMASQATNVASFSS